jgi:hypothetical protein
MFRMLISIDTQNHNTIDSRDCLNICYFFVTGKKFI